MNPSEELRDELAQLRRELDLERGQRRLAESELARIDALYRQTVSSSSWRLTYPARVAGMVIRRGVAQVRAAMGRARSALTLARQKAGALGHRWQTAIGDRISYPMGMKVLVRFYDLPPLHRGLFRKSLEDLEHALAGVVRTTEHEKQERPRLFSRAFDAWWVRRASRSRWEEIRAWFPTTGIDRLQRALAAGRGVLLVNAHFGGGRLVPLVLVRSGYEVVSIECSDVLANADAKVSLERLSVIALQETFKARAVMQAVRALRAGKIVHLAGDGYRTTALDSVRTAFFGRKRFFAKGFAEMAMETGAAVLPVFAPFDDRGRVHVEILEPLDPGDETMDRDRRVEELIRQYASVLEQRWRSDFRNVNRFFLRKFLLLSEAR